MFEKNRTLGERFHSVAGKSSLVDSLIADSCKFDSWYFDSWYFDSYIDSFIENIQ